MRAHDSLTGYSAIRDVNPERWVLARAYLDSDSHLIWLYFACPICGASLELALGTHSGAWPVLACFTSRGAQSGQTFGVSFGAPEEMVSV
jgi:hypothetical protein